jgi:hypothetical protein
MNVKSINLIKIVAASTVLFVINCDVPTEPGPFSWRVAAIFPEGISARDICVGDSRLYIAGFDHFDWEAAIWTFEFADGSLNKVYTSRYGDEAEFYAIDYYNGTVWVGGSRWAEVGGESGSVPVLAYLFDGSWYEVDVPGGSQPFNEVYDVAGIPGSEPDCYVNIADGIGLYRPLTEEWQVLNGMEGFAGPIRTEGGRFYCVRNDPSLRYFSVAVSDGSGSDFVMEETPVTWGRFETFKIHASPDRTWEWGSPVGEGIALFGSLSWEGDDSRDYSGLVIRDEAPAGVGTYTLSFFSLRAPDFYEISTCAFKDRSNGCATGQETSIFMVNGEWAKETPSDNPERLRNVVVYGARYYAAGVYKYDGDDTVGALYYSER